jgi:hypothetical protein
MTVALAHGRTASMSGIAATTGGDRSMSMDYLAVVAEREQPAGSTTYMVPWRLTTNTWPCAAW